MSDGHFLVNHYWLAGSVIVFPKRFYLWNVADASEIKPHTLELLNFVKPRPDYLIIGTGEKSISLDFTFYEHFRRMGITVDSCPSVINNSNSFEIYYSLRHVVHLTCAMKTDIMWHAHWFSQEFQMKLVEIQEQKVLRTIMSTSLLKH